MKRSLAIVLFLSAQAWPGTGIPSYVNSNWRPELRLGAPNAIDPRTYMDGQSGRPTLSAWQANMQGTDVIAVLNAATTAAYDSNTPLHLPRGIYKITTTWKLRYPITVYGDGEPYSIIKPAVGTDANAIDIGEKSSWGARNGWDLRNFSILGPANSCHHAMTVTYASRINIKNITILTGTNASGYALDLAGCIYGTYEDITIRTNPTLTRYPDLTGYYAGAVISTNGIRLEGVYSQFHHDGVAVSGDATFTSALGSWTNGNIGDIFKVEGAGVAGAELQTTIASVNSAHSVELTVAPSTSVPAATYRSTFLNASQANRFAGIRLSGFAGSAIYIDEQADGGDNSWSDLTIENTTGYTLYAQGCRFGTFQDVHCESEGPVLFTNCENMEIGPNFCYSDGLNNSICTITGCTDMVIDNSRFSRLTINADCTGTVLGQINMQSTAFVDNGAGTIYKQPINVAGVTNQMIAGRTPDKENLLTNTWFESWTTGVPTGWTSSGWTWTKTGDGLGDTTKRFGRYAAKAVSDASYATFAVPTDKRFSANYVTFSVWTYTPTQTQTEGPIVKLVIGASTYYPYPANYATRDAWAQSTVCAYCPAGQEGNISIGIGGRALSTGFYLSGPCLFAGFSGTNGFIAHPGEVPENPDYVNVRSYGAKGDWNGSTGTDDTAAIQAAIDSLNTATGASETPTGLTGGIVVFPTGKYKITSALKVYEGTYLVGTGKYSSQIYNANTAGANAVSFVAPTRALAGTGTLATNGVAAAGDATFTSATGGWSTADVGKYIYINGAGPGGALLVTTIASRNSSTSIELTNAPSTSVNPATYFYVPVTHFGGARDLEIVGNASSGHGIYVGEMQCSKSFERLSIHGHGVCGVYMASTVAGTWYDCHVEYNYSWGARIAGTLPSPWAQSTTASFHSCKFRGNGLLNDGSGGAYVEAGVNCKFDGKCTFESNLYGPGLWLGGTYCNVEGAYFENNDNHLIQMQVTGYGHTIRDTYLDAGYIWLASTANNNQIIGTIWGTSNPNLIIDATCASNQIIHSQTITPLHVTDGSASTKYFDVNGIAWLEGDLKINNHDIQLLGGSIFNGSTTGKLTMSGGDGSGYGGTLNLYGESHATKPNTIELISGTATATMPPATGTVAVSNAVSHNYKSAADPWSMTAAEAAGSLFTVTSASGPADAVFPAAVAGKQFTVYNNSGQAITFKVTGQTGAATTNAKYSVWTMNTTDCVKVYEQP
jgi:hypothetical protein